MENTALQLPQNQESEIENETLSLYEKSTSLVVRDQDTYTQAGELGKGIKALIAKITEYHEPLRLAAKATYDAVLKRKNDDLAPCSEALEIVRGNMNKYAQEQERIRQEEERKARAIAEENARKEREKLEAQALSAMQKGKDEKAESLMEKAENVYVAPVTTASTLDKTIRTDSGTISQAKEIKVTVVDMVAFLKALIENNPGAVASIVKIGDGPLKSFVKTNGIDKYAGLRVERTVGVRI